MTNIKEVFDTPFEKLTSADIAIIYLELDYSDFHDVMVSLAIQTYDIQAGSRTEYTCTTALENLVVAYWHELQEVALHEDLRNTLPFYAVDEYHYDDREVERHFNLFRGWLIAYHKFIADTESSPKES